MTLEVRIPISPRPAWFNRVRLIARSIREFYPEAMVRVSIGDAEIDPPEHYWTRDIDDIRYNWLEKAEFMEWAGTRSEYLATMMDRYKPPFFGDHILMLDADVICIRRFDELFQNPGISGVMTHVPPFGKTDWVRLFNGFGLPDPNEWHEHSGWGVMVTHENFRHSPPYFNSGMVFGAREAFETLSEPYFRSLAYMRRVLSDTYWFDQLGLALAMAAADVQTNILPLRWNFPNQRGFDEKHPDELADVRFIHAMREDQIHRDRDFADEAALRRLVERRDLVGSNEALRARIAELMVTA